MLFLYYHIVLRTILASILSILSETAYYRYRTETSKCHETGIGFCYSVS